MTGGARLNDRSSICLIVCYFGKLPPYVDCVFRSCAANPDINWLIFTDDQTPRKPPPNVRIEPATFNGLMERFSKKLGFTVSASGPYRLCNYRPAFGVLFDDYLQDYDFWGHCDLDMIFGDLRKYLREEILSAYTKVLNRGHMTLYRNSSEANKYFLLEAPGMPNYRQWFAEAPETHEWGFDEWNGISKILRYHGVPQYHDEFIIDVAPPTKWKLTRFEGTAIQNYPEQVFYWHNGKVYHAHYNCDRGVDDDEYAYIHFQKRSLPAPAFDPFEASGFLITPGGFFPYNREPLTRQDFATYNHSRWRPLAEIAGAAKKSLWRRLGIK